MFMMLGSALSFVIGLIGILNFFNAILTGIAVRKREFAMLQSIGMTGKQLKTMLIIEGLLYTLSSVIILSLIHIWRLWWTEYGRTVRNMLTKMLLQWQ